MRSNKERLRDSRLYVILDADVQPYDKLFEIASEAVEAGADIFQLRDKQGVTRETLQETRRLAELLSCRAIFVINDRVDIAQCVEGVQVHVGQNDLPVQEARHLTAGERIVGTSCQSLEHLREAERAGADYVGFGSVFRTQTKPGRDEMDLELLREASATSSIPLFAIGGIREENLSQVLAFGVARVAICRDICLADDVKAKVRSLRKILDKE